MHIPDGFLDPKTWATLDVASVGGIAYAVKKARETLDDKKIPIMGVMAAFVFAAQMLNFPVLGGTSGHLLGGVLAAVLLGPWAAAIVIASVLIVQAVFFQDGGLLVMGANVFNMAIVGTLGGYLVYSQIRRLVKGNIGILAGTFVASWASVFLAAGVTAIELVVSGTTPAAVALPAMAGVHAIIGIGEAIITTSVIAFVLQVRPDLIPGAVTKRRSEPAATPAS
ncbi:MAG: energy-coupling factor ABC transporter permease [Actinomycetota bacterium]